MRISGHVIGALTTTAIRRSVIFSAEGSDARLTLACTTLAAAAAAASPLSVNVAEAVKPKVLKKERRSTEAGAGSSILRTRGFMVDYLGSRVLGFSGSKGSRF